MGRAQEHLDDLVVKAQGGVQSAQAMLGRVSAHKIISPPTIHCANYGH
jgi:hypothetical protein